VTGRIATPLVGRGLESKSKGLGNESLAFFFSGHTSPWRAGHRPVPGLAAVRP